MQSCSKVSCLIAWRTTFASCPMCTHRLISTSQTWFAYARQNFREDGRVLGCSARAVGQTRPLMASRFTKFSELQFDSFVQVSMNERRLRDASTIRSDAVETGSDRAWFLARWTISVSMNVSPHVRTLRSRMTKVFRTTRHGI